jgi:hypothetical protein
VSQKNYFILLSFERKIIMNIFYEKPNFLDSIFHGEQFVPSGMELGRHFNHF